MSFFFTGTLGDFEGEIKVEERTFEVPNISCAHCATTIERELQQLEGVSSVEADVASQRVAVRWDAPATWEQICARLEEIGFPPAA